VKKFSEFTKKRTKGLFHTSVYFLRSKKNIFGYPKKKKTYNIPIMSEINNVPIY